MCARHDPEHGNRNHKGQKQQAFGNGTESFENGV